MPVLWFSHIRGALVVYTLDYTCIDVNARVLKSFLVSQVWCQAVDKARTNDTNSQPTTITIRPPRYCFVSVCIRVCTLDYRYIDVNARVLKSFLASQVWSQAITGARTNDTNSQPTTITIWPPRHCFVCVCVCAHTN